MSKRKRGRVAKAQASSKVRPKTARSGEPSRRANSKQARVLQRCAGRAAPPSQRLRPALAGSHTRCGGFLLLWCARSSR